MGAGVVLHSRGDVEVGLGGGCEVGLEAGLVYFLGAGVG